MTCKTHPDAPHGFDRNGSHSEDRYVCECESWEPPPPRALVLADELYRYGTLNNPNDAADELRRLHAENEKLQSDLRDYMLAANAEAELVDMLQKENRELVRMNGGWQEKHEAADALLRQALAALESADWYINQLEQIVYCVDDTATHEERAKVQSAITTIKERLG
jgi:myosin heavy subunit